MPGDGLVHLAACCGVGAEALDALYPRPVEQSMAPALLDTGQQEVPDDRGIDELAELLDAGRRAKLLCGRGCAHELLLKLADALKSPIVHAFGG